MRSWRRACSIRRCCTFSKLSTRTWTNSSSTSPAPWATPWQEGGSGEKRGAERCGPAPALSCACSCSPFLTRLCTCARAWVERRFYDTTFPLHCGAPWPAARALPLRRETRVRIWQPGCGACAMRAVASTAMPSHGRAGPPRSCTGPPGPRSVRQVVLVPVSCGCARLCACVRVCVCASVRVCVCACGSGMLLGGAWPAWCVAVSPLWRHRAGVFPRASPDVHVRSMCACTVRVFLSVSVCD